MALIKDNYAFHIKPPPPPNLNKELLGVWSAWSRMGDREVAREAVAKGQHVSLAQTFLAARIGLDSDNIEKWFKSEVFGWVSELLVRQQVFKASHILTNFNLDPLEEFIRIFLECYDRNMRNHLGNHLKKIEKLESSYKMAWDLLEIILDQLEDFAEDFNVWHVHSKDIEWKNTIGTRVFFKTYDVTLKPYVTPVCAWNYLLINSKLELLKLWIQIYHTKNTLNSNAPQQANEMFLQFEINEHMIDLITDLDISSKTREEIFNELSKFGIFNRTEKNDLIKIVTRLLHCENIENFRDILNGEKSTVSLLQFEELLIRFCYDHELFTVLNSFEIDYSLHQNLLTTLKSKHLNLISYLRNDHNIFSDEKSLGQMIFKFSEFFNHNFIEYPLIFFAIVFFLYPDIDLFEIFQSNKIITLGNLTLEPKTIKEILANLPFLNGILNRPNIPSLTYLDLLKRHSDLDLDRFEFKRDGCLPNFNSKYLVEEYGYKKTRNFVFYLKQSRPGFASKIFFLDKFERSKVFPKILKLVATNFTNMEIAASSVAFLEMIGEDSTNLRVYITAANILSETKNFTQEEIQNLLWHVQESPENFLNALEKSLVNNYCSYSDYSGLHLVDDIKSHEIAVKFARCHKLNLPELYLKDCVKHNLWLPFLIFVQIYCYPLNVIKKLIQEFQNSKFSEHLLNGISHEIQLDDLLIQEYDSRKSYLSRIGVRKNIEGSPDTVYSSASSSSYGSHVSMESYHSSGSDLLDIEQFDVKTNLLRTLIKCHNSFDPPKALLQACYVYKCPIFAVLATSYEPDSIITNWVAWLSVSCNIEMLLEETINVKTITNLLKRALKNGYCKTVHESFLIFLPEHPLKFFLEFLNSSTELNFNLGCGTKILNQFHCELMQRKPGMAMVDVDYYDMQYIFNKTWIEKTACTLLAVTINNAFQSRYYQMRFFKLLHDVQICKFFQHDMPDFLRFYNTFEYLIQLNCDIKLDLSSIFDIPAMNCELNACLEKLVGEKYYDCAFNIAKIHGLSSDFVIIREWENKLEYGIDKNFWEECDRTFTKAEVDPLSAVEFFEVCCEKTTEDTEKYTILCYAHKWASCYNLPNLYEVEKEMWLAYFNSGNLVECHTLSNRTRLLYTDIKERLSNFQNVDEHFNISPVHVDRLNATIERSLNDCDLWQAIRLSKIFNHENSDLHLIILCSSLAEGLIMPYQLTADERMLLIKREHILPFSRRRRTLISSKRLSSLSSNSHSPASTIMPLTDQIDSAFQDTLAILEVLVERVKNGSGIAHDILMAYRISVNIEKSYREVFTNNNPLVLLKQALNDDCNNKLEVVHDFTLLFKWSKDQIAELLCEQLILTITDHIKNNIEPITLWNINLNTDSHVILQLLMENCSVLGLKLYTRASGLHKNQSKIDFDFIISEVNLVIELLIRAHDCFTADCNMEGISMILRKCQPIISLLLTLKSWKLIVRLLTGVARYTEMNYVFHILKENDQFEFLLRKGNRHDNSLKVALLKYLRKYCPENRELYRMVALHFTLFSEIAELWEEEARSIVRNLIAISKLEMQNNGLNVDLQPYVLFTNTDGTKICLNKVMINYTHATEYHMQGEKLAKAMSSAKQAELVALQISMMKGLCSTSTAICVLNLDESHITSLICNELSFPQSLILVEACNHKTDWSAAVFQQYVIHNQSSYLEAYLGTFPLTDTLVHDISRKFLSLKAISDVNTRNMKEIVKKCASVHTKYRIASELGFSDVVEELLAGNQLAYLKDTVWKKGYKS